MSASYGELISQAKKKTPARPFSLYYALKPGLKKYALSVNRKKMRMRNLPTPTPSKVKWFAPKGSYNMN